MEYEVLIVTFVGCTPDAGGIVVDWIVDHTDVGDEIVEEGVIVGCIDGCIDGVTILALVCAIVGEMLG
jgi:hypothetical protein